MVWRLPATSNEVFQRNTLVQVVCQLRFHPILKIAERLPDFQERVRRVFPDFLEQTTAVAAMTAEGAVELQQEKQFMFRKVNANCTLALTSGSLAVEERRHTERQKLFDDVLLAIRALEETQQLVQPKRLGLRYINIIDRERIAKDLGEPSSGRIWLRPHSSRSRPTWRISSRPAFTRRSDRQRVREESWFSGMACFVILMGLHDFVSM